MKRTAVFAVCVAAAVAGLSLVGCGQERAYDYDLSKYIKVGEYKGLEYTEPKAVKITAGDIGEAVKSDLESNQYLQDVEDGKVHEGDTINIDYTGTVGGKKFDGGSAKDTTLVVGSDNFIDGFSSGLVDKEVGKTVTLNLTFPDPYSANADLSGKKVKFKVKINSAQEYVTPTEEYYVKNNTKYGTTAKYEAAVKKRLEKEAKQQQKEDIKEELWNQMYEGAEVKEYPDKEVQDYINDTRKSVEDYAKQYDIEFKDFLDQYYNMDEKEFNKQLKTAARDNCKAQMITYYIADQEKVSVDKDEYDKFIKEQLDSVGYSEEEFKDYTGQTYEEYVGGSDSIYYYLTYQKVMDIVLDNAKVKAK